MNIVVLDGVIERAIANRRDFHKHAEVAWTEFRTAAKVADVLTSLGYAVEAGTEVISANDRMGVPPNAELEKHCERALAQGANPHWIEKMRGGFTGVEGTMTFSKPGPTIALRFDMDANDVTESDAADHRPVREGFASINKEAMHACAHDGHTAIGLAVAEVLALMQGELAGTVKLIFQPAEEGVRGAKAMVAKGVVVGVDYLFGLHLGANLTKLGQIACGTKGFLATTKLDATFTGKAAHAGASPEAGKNALLAAAAAALNLHAIPRHSKGVSRINVGVLKAGTGRNVVPADAVLKLETRGETTEINDFIYAESMRILQAAAAMYDVSVKIDEMGGAASGVSDDVLVEQMRQYAEKSKLFTELCDVTDIGGSEDCTYLMDRVQKQGGKASYIMIGTELAAGHHNSRFDFDEAAIGSAVKFMSGAVAEMLLQEK